MCVFVWVVLMGVCVFCMYKYTVYYCAPAVIGVWMTLQSENNVKKKKRKEDDMWKQNRLKSWSAEPGVCASHSEYVQLSLLGTVFFM